MLITRKKGILIPTKGPTQELDDTTLINFAESRRSFYLMKEIGAL